MTGQEPRFQVAEAHAPRMIGAAISIPKPAISIGLMAPSDLETGGMGIFVPSGVSVRVILEKPDWNCWNSVQIS
jgi:hypothetical protein